MFSLDRLWSDGLLPAVNLIKCDAEDSELGILQGGIQLLSKNLPSLLIEVQQKTGTEVFQLLHSIGYKSFVLKKGLAEVDGFDPEIWNYTFLSPSVVSARNSAKA